MAATLTAGDRLGRYEILEPVGSGGMGEVYRASDTQLPRTVALKTLRLGEDCEERRRLLEREARIASRLSHPNICTLHDVGRENDVDFLVMEFLEGQTLRDRLARSALTPRETIRLGTQIAGALSEAHRHGIVHRDLKPSNVMLVGHGARKRVKLLDFGVARWRDRGAAANGASGEGTNREDTGREGTAREQETLTFAGQLVGTTAYMSPEQIQGLPVDGRSDLFSFGSVLYEMLAGQPAFVGDTQAKLMAQILEHDPQDLRQAAPRAPAHLVHVIERCLEKEPGERWQSAADVRRELDWSGHRVVADEEPPGVTGPGPAAAPGSSRPRAPEEESLRPAIPLFVALGAAALALYLNNPSVRDAGLYPLLAAIGALPAVHLVAAFSGVKASVAARRMSDAFGSLGGLAGGEQSAAQRRSVGIAVGLFLGSILAFLLGHAANDTMPHLRFLPHATNEFTEWVLDDPSDDWANFRNAYKSKYLEHNGASEAAYQAHKYAMGRGSIRAARTLFAFACILLLAGVVDLAKRRLARGSTTLALGLVTALALYVLWYDRQGHYAAEMVAASTRLPEELRPELPASAPDGLKSLAGID